MIVLRPHNLHWIDGTADNPKDLCAHASVDCRIGDSVLIRPEDGVWTVSAAAIYLLRTLSQDHTKAQPIGEHLIPRSGVIFEAEKSDDVAICECNLGVDFEVVHSGDQVILTAAEHTQYTVAAAEWAKAVCEFSDTVRAFYSQATPKEPYDASDLRAFRQLQSEWSRRKSAAESQLQR